ncbi:MAG: (2Fe-2S) ferredoxin domain-containing protein [Lachnospiraceae bacterium]
MKIEICIGSSCHLRGSQAVIKKLDLLCKEYELGKTIQLCGSFCMGACQNGVSVRLDGIDVYHVLPEEVEKFFKEEVLRRLN